MPIRQIYITLEPRILSPYPVYKAVKFKLALVEHRTDGIYEIYREVEE